LAKDSPAGFRPNLSIDEREEALKKDLISFGYDANFNLPGARSVVLSVTVVSEDSHEECDTVKLELSNVSFRQAAYDVAMGKHVDRSGLRSSTESSIAT
jgi:hypothetical protein